MTTALTVYPVNTNSGVLTSAGLLVNVTGGATGGASGTLIGTSTGWGEITWNGTSAAWPSVLPINPTGRGALLDGSLLFGQQIITGNWQATLKFLASTTGTTFNGTVMLRFYKYNSDTGVYTNIGTIQVSGQSITNAGTVVSFPATSAPAMSLNNNEYLYVDTWFNCTSSSGATSTSKIKISTSVSTSQGNASFEIITPGYQVAPAKTTGLRTPVRTKVTKSLGLRILARTRNTRSDVLRIAARTQKTAATVLRTVVGGRARWASLRAIVRTRTSVWAGIRTLVTTGGAQITRALGLRTIVSGNVPLTLYGTNTAAHTVPTANTMIANVTGAAPSATTTLVGQASGWGEAYAQGNVLAWPALGAIGAPSDQGWLYDSTALEGWQIPFGNWVTTLRLYVSVGSITADISVGAWKRAADGTYTQIGNASVLLGQSITTTVAAYSLPNVAQPGTAFGVGDKLYLGVWLNITTSNTGWSLATLSCNASNSGTLGSANNLVVITPGIQALGSPVTRGANLRAQVRSAQFGASLLRILARTKATRSSALRLVTQARVVSRALSLRVRTTVPPRTMSAGIRVVTLDPPSTSNAWYSTTAISQGPLVYYRMGETVGTTAAFDATGNNQQGVITGGVTLGTRGLLAGDNDLAMSFDGISGAIRAPLDPTLPGMPQGAQAWSMAVWIQLSAYPTSLACVMDFATSATDPNQALSFDSSVLPLNSPCFLIATYDGGTLTLSIGVGGAVTVAGSIPMTCNLVGTQFGVGSRADGTSHLAAIIDEPALFPYALTPAQGQALYQAGITVPPQPLPSSNGLVGFATSQFAGGAVPNNNPLGQTMNIPNNHPGMPDQAIIDMVGGTGRGGTVPGWGAGASIRYQQHWGQATEPAADHVYDWSAVDSTVDRCTAAGVSVLWVLSYPPTQYLTVRASDGVDTGSPGAEYANAATWTYFCRQVAARYNGTSINALTGAAQTPRLIPELSIYNEEYDEGDHLPRDDQSKWLVPVVQQAAPAIKALHPSVILGVGAVRHTYNNSRGHIAAWLTNLFTTTPPGSHMAGIGNLVKWISFHYYRGGSGDNFPNPDPTSSSADMPSVGQQIDLMFATVRPLGFTGDIYCNEFGWACYDGEKGVITVTPDVQSQYLFDMIDACRTHGVAKTHIFTLNPGSHVNLANTPPTADAVRSIVQTINNVYTYLPAYQMMVKYHHDFPVWNKSVTPKTMDGMGRFTLVAQSTVSRANPYGVTLYVDPKANPLHIPAQLLIDLAGGSGGSPAGWGKNPCLRWQLHWTDVEPNADGNYDWSRVDNAIDDCLSAGVYLMWPIEYAPGGYLTIRASDGATVAAGTGDLASPAAWKTFMRAVAARYNGTTKNAITGATQVARILPEAQIGNEEYDQFTPYDFQGTLLGDVAKVAIPAYKAIHPTGRISLGSVRKKTNDAVAHFGNWIDGLYTHMGGDLADAITIHYYRGGTFNPDPTTSNHADTPSIAECLAALLAGVTRNGGTAEVYIDEYGWDAYDDGSGTTPVVTLAQQSQFIKDVLEAWRTGGGARANLFWIEPGAVVNLTKTPPTSTAIKSITQHISGVYTYLPAYTMIANYAKTYPYWGTAATPKTMDGMGRFNLVAPGGGVTPLTLYATTVPAAEGALAGTLAVVEGGTQVTMSTLVGTAKGYGELPALGSTLAWPARTGFQTPDGRGWYLDGTILDSQMIASGVWSGVVRIGPPAGTGMVGDIWVRLFRFTPVGSLYTHIGDLTASGVALVGLLNATLAANTFAAVTFLPNDRLYAELWLDITTPSSVAGTLMHVVETSTAGAGHASNVQIFTPGYSPVTVPVPVTVNGMGRFALTAPHRTKDAMGRFALRAPGQTAMNGIGRFVLHALAVTGVAIGDASVPFDESTVLINQYLDERWRCQFTALDYAGTETYAYGARVVVSDQALGPLFSGFVADDTQDKTNTLVDPTIEHKIDCIDNRHRADKRTSNRLYTTPTPAGKIVIDMLADVLTAEGVQANYAIRADTTAADWNAGTLANTVGASTIGDGNLELAPAGTLVTKVEQVAADWNAGTLAGTMVNGDLLQLAAHPALSFSGVCSSGYGNAYAYYKIWAGGYVIQNGDTLAYRVWVSSDSPEIKAGIDGICTDGTSIRDFNRLGGGAGGPPDGFIFDQNGIRAHPNSDLSGVANDQWYTRKIDLSVLAGKTLAHIDLSFEGGNAGTYQAYFYDIWMQNASGAITQNFYGNRGVVSPLLTFPNLSAKVSNIGYSNIQIRAVTAYEGSGTRTSPNFSIATSGICQSSQIDWLATTPEGASFVVSTSIDTGSTFQPATSLGAITNLMAGAATTGRTVTTKEILTITGKDPTVTPQLSRLFFQVVPAYQATKQDTFKTFTSRADWLTGTINETAAATGDLFINSVQRNWNDQQTTGQTFFGGPGRQSIWRNAGALRANGAPPPGTVSRARLDFAGAWRDFIMSIDVSVPTTNVFAGIEYRTTYFDNNPNTGGYLVDLTPTSFNFGRGTNSAGGIHTTIQTKVLSPPMTVADWHTITIVALGNQHTVYLDGVAFWGTVTDTTANLQGAGSFALRVYNNTIGDQTCYFDNFGIMPIDGIYPGLGPLFSGPTWTSPVIPLGNFTGGSSLLFWDATTALGDYLNVLTNFNGAGYQVATSGAAIPGIGSGTAYTNATLQILVQMQAATPADTPVIHGLTAWVSSQYAATGTRVSPALDLTPVGRLGSSLVAWNAILATNTALTVEVGNGTTWTDVTGSNGGTIPPYAVRPDPTIDTFGTNTSASYTSTSFSGGTVAAWTWNATPGGSPSSQGLVRIYYPGEGIRDTGKSSLSVAGGVNAVLLASGIVAGDIDALFDTDMSDTLGLVWRYTDGNNCYFLEVHDSLSSTGTPQVVQVWKRAGGVNTQLRRDKSATFTRGIPHRFRVTMTGGFITVIVSGNTVYTFTDTTPLSPGQVGLRTNGGQGTVYQLRIQPLGDDVTGKEVQTRLTLVSTDPTVTPQVEDLSMVAFDAAIGPGTIIPSADYRYTFVDKNLDDLAKKSNYDVWFDASVALHFNSRVANPAPWILASNQLGLASDIELDSNLAVEVLGDVYRNRQVLTGVTNTGLFQDPFKGNGKDTSFTLGYKVAPGTVPAITLNGNRQTVGPKGASGFQWYYAEGDLVIAEDTSGIILQDIDTLSISYTGTFTDTVVVDNVQAQVALQGLSGGTGIVESVIDVSNPGMMYPAAVVYANQLLERYCITNAAGQPTGRKIVAKTYRGGLAVGQMLPVFLPEEGIWNGQFLITEIDITMQTQPKGAVLYGYLVTATELPNLGGWARLLASGLLE